MTATAVETRPPGPSAEEDAPERPPRRRRTVVLAALAVGVVVTVAAIAVGTRPQAGTTVAPSPLIGRPAPLAAGDTMIPGGPFDPASLHGKWALVNFFATWCVPCRGEHPELVAFSQRHANDAQVVSIAFQDDRTSVRSFFAAQGGNWPVVADPNGKTALDFGVTGVPESYLVDPSGTVRAKIVGGVRADALDALVAREQAQVPTR